MPGVGAKINKPKGVAMCLKRAAFAAAGLVIVFAAAPSFGAQRTFVSASGNDVNPCSLVSPCRGFAAAIAQTDVGGEVIVKDSAGYGTVTITKSVSIIAPAGVYAGITVFAGNTGVAVNGAGIKVLLRGLTINGLGVGQYGVHLQNAAELVVDRCVVANMATAGIRVSGSNNIVAVSDTAVRGTTNGPGVWIASNAQASLQRVRLFRNQGAGGHGVLVDASSRASIAGSVISLNEGDGVRVAPGSGLTAEATIVDSLLSDNQSNGVLAVAMSSAGTIAAAAVSRSVVTRNDAGIAASATAPGVATVSTARNSISYNFGDGIVAAGSGAVIAASENTFAQLGGNALEASGGATVRTVRGADGLPANAGEVSSATSGNVVPVSPF
jgi:hypothetical protein